MTLRISKFTSLVYQNNLTEQLSDQSRSSTTVAVCKIIAKYPQAVNFPEFISNCTFSADVYRKCFANSPKPRCSTLRWERSFTQAIVQHNQSLFLSQTHLNTPGGSTNGRRGPHPPGWWPYTSGYPSGSGR